MYKVSICGYSIVQKQCTKYCSNILFDKLHPSLISLGKQHCAGHLSNFL